MYLAIDLGGTNCRVVPYANLVDTDPLGPAEQFKVSQHQADKPGDFGGDFHDLLQCCTNLVDRYGDVAGIGLALAGKLDSTRSSLVMAGNIAHWCGKPVKSLLENQFGCRVSLGNDAEAAALAEATYGLGVSDEFQGKPLMGMIWGTGVGGACVRPLPSGGFLTIPGEPGHITLNRDTVFTCRGCEEPGHLEAYCGGANLKLRFGKEAPELTPLQWTIVANDMAIGLKSILCLQPVRLVTFSGRVACAQEWLLPLLEAELDSDEYGRPAVRKSAFGESAGTLGALSLLNL